MHYLKYNEEIQHRTGELPLAHYYVDEHHPRYHMRTHWHRETELLWVRRGTLTLYLDDRPFPLSAGDMMILGDGVLHGGEPEDALYECIVFDPYALLMHIAPCKEAMKPVVGHTMHLPKAAIGADPALNALLDDLYQSARENRNVLNTVGALYALYGHLLDRPEHILAHPASRTGVKAEQLKSALEYIENNYSSRITLDALARLTGMSPKYFCKCFRSITHRSPIDYLNHYRIECAAQMLSTTDMSVADIAQQCGYNDSSFFIKQFRKYKDTTPYKYRADNQ